MPTSHLVRATVPEDSPLRTLAGRTVTAPASSLPEVAVRIAEMRRAGLDPVVVPVARPMPWTRIAVTLAAAVLAAMTAAIAAILTGHHTSAWIAAGAMVLLGLGLFPVLTHLEMDS